MATAKAKTFPTLAVVGVYTGTLLQNGGFGALHDVMDHLFPGVMTIGVAAMQPTAAKYLAAHVSGLADLPPVGDDWRAFADEAVARFGDTITVVGPLNVSEEDIAAAFAAFGRDATRNRPPTAADGGAR